MSDIEVKEPQKEEQNSSSETSVFDPVNETAGDVQQKNDSNGGQNKELANFVRKTDADDPNINTLKGDKKEELSNEINGVDSEIEKMFSAGLHFGYSRTRRHPKMQPYIFGLRNNIEVFDLERVSEKLKEAEVFLKELAQRGGMVLLVGSKPSAAPLIEKAAYELGMPYSNRRWPGGLLTNFNIVRKRIDYFEDLKAKKASGELAKYTKKEQHDFTEEIIRLERKFAGLVLLKKRPDAMVIVDPKEEKTATREAKHLGIETVGIMNIDNNPEGVKHVVPANDSAHSSIKYVLNRLVTAYKQGLSDAVLPTEQIEEIKKEEKKQEKNG